MKKTTTFTLLSEEVDSKTLMNLVGGADTNPIRTFPHDLVTPASSTEPYDNDQIEES